MAAGQAGGGPPGALASKIECIMAEDCNIL